MHDLEIGGVELQPNYGPGQAGDFGGANCFDSNLKTACRPNTASEKSAISLELKGPCFETTKTCPQFDIKSITIYTPTVNVQGYQAGTHNIKVSLRTSSKKGKLASACLWCWTIVFITNKLVLQNVWNPKITLQYLFVRINHPQVIVSSTFERNDVDGSLLGEYTGDMPLDQKFDITYDSGYLRGRWITILDDQAPSSLTVAEIRIYGSKYISEYVHVAL